MNRALTDAKTLATEVAKKYRRAVVTGGAGFIASHIIEALLDTNMEVVCVDDLSAGKQENIDIFSDRKNYSFHKADVSNAAALRGTMRGADIVFHNAASKKNICLVDPRRDLAVNGEGAFNTFSLAVELGVKKVVHASTGSVYGEPTLFPQTEDHPLDPVSYYGVSKLAGERYGTAIHKLDGLDVTILRYFHVYGPRQEWDDQFGGVISIFLRRGLTGKNLIVHGDGQQERSFTNVRDIVRANLLTATSPEASGQVYNCASGIKVTVQELAEYLIENVEGCENVKIEHGDPLIGDIRKFDVSSAKLQALGLDFEEDVWKGLGPTIKWIAGKVRAQKSAPGGSAA
jgi:nucleoside-diphosphate-sugar epimerase